MKTLCGSRGFAGPSACVLRAGHEGPHQYGNFDDAVLKYRNEELERLRAENAELRTDAERYRWICATTGERDKRERWNKRHNAEITGG